MTTKAIEVGAWGAKKCTDNFSNPVRLYVEPEARERWEKENPEGDWYEQPQAIDELASYKIIAEAVLEAAIASGELVPASAVAEEEERGDEAVRRATDLSRELAKAKSETASAVAAERERCAREMDTLALHAQRTFDAFSHGRSGPCITAEAYKFAAVAIRSLSPEPASGEFVVVPDQSSAVADIAAERKRQREAEGWSSEHDDVHSDGTMASAAAAYIFAHSCGVAHTVDGDEYLVEGQELWPWDLKWWKPKGRRRNLVRAGALIVAEIERLDRAMLNAATKDGSGA